jgi:hypothetical protein
MVVGGRSSETIFAIICVATNPTRRLAGVHERTYGPQLDPDHGRYLWPLGPGGNRAAVDKLESKCRKEKNPTPRRWQTSERVAKW